jgi:hypothetical protein
MKWNFTVRREALDDAGAFLSVAQHRNIRKAAAEHGVRHRRLARWYAHWRPESV